MIVAFKFGVFRSYVFIPAMQLPNQILVAVTTGGL